VAVSLARPVRAGAGAASAGGLKVASVGDNCVDRYVGAVSGRYAGGNALNVAVRLAQAGYASAYLGAVGDDENGRFILASLGEAGVDASHAEVRSGPSGVTIVRVEGGERTFVSEEYGAAGSYCFVPAGLEFLEDRSWVHAARLSGASRALTLLADRGVPLSYDFTDHWDQTAAIELCPRLRAAFFSGSALGEEGARRLAEQAVERGARVGIVTRGAQGVVACVGDRLVTRAAEAVAVVDTLGAGDAFIAGYVAATLRGAEADEALDRGAREAAESCTHVGAWRLGEEVARS
jgi:fructoselysine 6-kinase